MSYLGLQGGLQGAYTASLSDKFKTKTTSSLTSLFNNDLVTPLLFVQMQTIIKRDFRANYMLIKEGTSGMWKPHTMAITRPRS